MEKPTLSSMHSTVGKCLQEQKKTDWISSGKITRVFCQPATTAAYSLNLK